MKIKVTLTRSFYFEKDIKGHKWDYKSQVEKFIDDSVLQSEVLFIQEMDEMIKNKSNLVMGHMIEEDLRSSLDKDFELGFRTNNKI